MFKIVRERKVWWPVVITQATNNGGTTTQTFSMRFIVRDVDASREMMREVQAQSDDDDVKLSQAYAEFVRKIAEDWKDVVVPGEGDKMVELEFGNDADLASAMAVPGAYEAVLKAYRDCVNGEQASRSGN